jgi:hypothetical protein
MKLFFIEALSGCSCCLADNHYRGPYKTQEDAERRLECLRQTLQTKHGRPWKCWVTEKDVRVAELGTRLSIWICDGRWFYESDLIDVNQDGTIDAPERCEVFCSFADF